MSVKFRVGQPHHTHISVTNFHSYVACTGGTGWTASIHPSLQTPLSNLQYQVCQFCFVLLRTMTPLKERKGRRQTSMAETVMQDTWAWAGKGREGKHCLCLCLWGWAWSGAFGRREGGGGGINSADSGGYARILRNKHDERGTLNRLSWRH